MHLGKTAGSTGWPAGRAAARVPPGGYHRHHGGPLSHPEEDGRPHSVDVRRSAVVKGSLGCSWPVANVSL